MRAIRQGVIIEFKYAKQKEQLKEQAIAAMQQILGHHYDSQLKQSPFVKQIVKIGVAFCDKAVVATYQTNDSTQTLWSDTYCRDEEG